MERRPFEEAFKSAFRGAELEPEGSVWTNIELDLARAEGRQMKSRVLFYQLIAAASVIFAMCVIGVTYYASSGSPFVDKTIAVNQEPASHAGDENSSEREILNSVARTPEDDRQNTSGNTSKNDSKNNSAVSTKASTVNQMQRDGTSRSNHSTGAFHESVAGVEENMDVPPTEIREQKDVHVIRQSNPSAVELASVPRSLPPLYSHKAVVIEPNTGEPSSVDNVALFLAKLNDRERELADVESKDANRGSKEKIWTSVGFSAGNFSSPNVNVTQANPGIAAATKVATNQAKASGTAYTMGVSFGARVAKRWVLQGGVNYMTQMSDYTTSVAVTSLQLSHFKPASLNEFRDNASQKFVPTAPYSVNNNLRFISLPIQAGYLVLDRKMGIEVNAGVSTDMFLQNTIDPEGETLEKTTESRGADSPYRSLNFSGMLGTELSYRFADRYRVSLNPGIRYPFNSIYKDEVGVEATPLTFDVGLRFRYIFQ